jgi:hypothetical protein
MRLGLVFHPGGARRPALESYTYMGFDSAWAALKIRGKTKRKNGMKILKIFSESAFPVCPSDQGKRVGQIFC